MSDQQALAVVAVAAAVVAFPLTWQLTRVISTLVHEAGHALVAVISGRKLHAVKLFHRGGGCTTHSGVGTRGQVVTTMAGYLSPPIVGAALLLALQHHIAARFLLVVAVPVVLLLLVYSRNVFAVLVTVAVLSGLVFVVNSAAPGVQQGVVLALGVFLLFAGLRSVFELISLVRNGSRGNDAAMLAKMTRLPAMVWAVAYLGVCVGALYLSGRWTLAMLAAS